MIKVAFRLHEYEWNFISVLPSRISKEMYGEILPITQSFCLDILNRHKGLADLAVTSFELHFEERVSAKTDNQYLQVFFLQNKEKWGDWIVVQVGNSVQLASYRGTLLRRMMYQDWVPFFEFSIRLFPVMIDQ